jgi:hypothetical protein
MLDFENLSTGYEEYIILQRDTMPPSLRLRSKPSKRPVEYCQVYMRQTSHLIDSRVKEHHQNKYLEYLVKSGMEEHSINSEHHIQLKDTSIVITSTFM